jgi:hypothetical protein
MQARGGEPSLGELFSELSRQLTTLVRQEITLAKTETSHKVARVGKDVGMLAVGAAVLYAGLLGIGAAIILLLAHVMPAWVSALIVGVVVAAVGGFLVQRGREALTNEDLTPRQTVESLKENAAWAKEQTR